MVMDEDGKVRPSEAKWQSGVASLATPRLMCRDEYASDAVPRFDRQSWWHRAATRRLEIRHVMDAGWDGFMRGIRDLVGGRRSCRLLIAATERVCSF